MRSERLLDALERVGINPCGDNSCMFGSPGGMATNGGCRCFGGMGSGMYGWAHDARLVVRRLARSLRSECDSWPRNLATSIAVGAALCTAFDDGWCQSEMADARRRKLGVWSPGCGFPLMSWEAP